ncbi:aminotransferase class III-fold pyridoxal phosphate-dependent enzyme [Acidocella sp.]|uniref:aminotransferase class III-fold pyridoxal phosphate-dependent enzyme n=1 Tax=Acidocella sp. TaxID=50710 RepID=UPI003D04D42E
MTDPENLVALHTSPPAFSQEAAEQMAGEIFGAPGEARRLYGERDQNFRIKTAEGPGIILKILGPSELPEAVDFQISVLDHVKMMDPGLPVPRVRRAADGAGHVYVQDAAGTPHMARALEFQPGRVMDSIEPTPGLLRDVGATLARLNKAMANFFHPGAGQKIVWDLRAIETMRPFAALIEPARDRALVEDVLDRFLAFRPELARLRHQPVHNDLHPGNMLVNEDASHVTGLLDFGDMIHGPLIFDVAVTAAETVGETLDPVTYATHVIAGYDAVNPLEPAEFEALYEAIIARHALAATIMAWRKRNDPAGAEKLAALAGIGIAAIQAYLAEGKTAVVARFRAACATPMEADSAALAARRFNVLGKGLELSYEQPVHLVYGQGVHLYAPDGADYLDAYNNVPSVGHGNAHVADAISRQMRRLCANTRYLHETVVEYAERLTATLPDGLEQVLFVNSGSEANDAAYRIAKALTGKTGVIIMACAYHGITDVVAALSPYYGPFAQPLADFVEVLENPDPFRGRFSGPEAALLYAADVDRAIAALEARGHGVAMLLIDSAFVSSGIIDTPPGYFAAVARKVRAAGGLVTGDEVQSGFGRMGETFWGFARHGVVPDMVSMGKPMANGHPAGALVTRPEILEAFTRKIDFFSTFGGNPVSAAAALATLEVLQREQLQRNALRTGAFLRNELAGLQGEFPLLADVRGAGLMTGVEIYEEGQPSQALAKRIANGMRQARVLIGTEGPGGNVLKIRPPLPFALQDAARLLEALRGVLRGL